MGRTAPLIALVALLLLILAACAEDTAEEPAEDPATDEEETAEEPEEEPEPAGTGLSAVAPIYPLAWLTEQIAPGADVHLLTDQGEEAHDIELTPRGRERIERDDVVVYMGQLAYQPQVETAVEEATGIVVGFDEVVGTDVLREWDHTHDHSHDDHDDHGHDDHDDHSHDDHDDHGHDDHDDHDDHGHDDHDDHGHDDHDDHGHDDHDDHGHDDHDDHGHDGHDDHGHDGHDDHDDHGHDDHDDHGHGTYDPHAWFDPAAMGLMAEAVAAAFTELDPDHAELYDANADALVEEFMEVDALMVEQLGGTCTHEVAIVSHEAFAYLIEPFGHTQEGVSGAGGHGPASPARIAELVDLVDEEGIEYVLSEPIEGRADAEAVATEAGVEVLDVFSLEVVDEDELFEEMGFMNLLREQIELFAQALDCA